MLFVKIGPELINLSAVTRIQLVGEDDALRIHFAGGTAVDLVSEQGTAVLAAIEELWKRERRLEVVVAQVNGGNGHVRTQADVDLPGAGAAGRVDASEGGQSGARGGVRADQPAPGAEPLFAPQPRAGPGERPRRRRARSPGAAA